ncbi:MAG: phosphatase PAP2 family protein [Proteobacteria bacterium]|nr:phosphatase PAP2 family protein [Pseudomonadota bacterium]
MNISSSIAMSLVCAGLMSLPCAASTKTGDKIEKAGTIVAIGLPIVAGGISLLHHRDWNGVAELVESTALTVGTSLLLKQIVHERRPDFSDYQSFPSDTAALAFSPAAYLWDRYGWQYGAPAFAAAAFVGYSRVEAKQHHWYDVAASSVLAIGINYALVTRYHENDRYSVSAISDGDSVGVRVSMNW